MYGQIRFSLLHFHSFAASQTHLAASGTHLQVDALHSQVPLLPLAVRDKDKYRPPAAHRVPTSKLNNT